MDKTPRNPKYRDEAWLAQSIEAHPEGFTRRLLLELRAVVRELSAASARAEDERQAAIMNAEQRDAANARADATERDARRYQYARDHQHLDEFAEQDATVTFTQYQREIDAAIDAAMQQGET